jgi:hypothetical protein
MEEPGVYIVRGVQYNGEGGGCHVQTIRVSGEAEYQAGMEVVRGVRFIKGGKQATSESRYWNRNVK